MHDQYISLQFHVPEEHQDLLIALISELPFSGIEQSMDLISILFNQNDYDEQYVQLISDLCTHHSIDCIHRATEYIQDQNWNKDWEDSLEPIFVNERIAITPTWKLHEVHHPLTIVINPQMAFGTGYHPTTRMVCKELEDWVYPNSNWIDAGCGSGVLAILTAKLGAHSVFAFDNDEWSVQNAKDNALLNEVEHIVVSREDIFHVSLESVDGIAANMYRNLILPNLPKFYDALCNSKGVLILSGILAIDADEIIRSAITYGFKHIKTMQEQDWVAITLRA